MAGWITCPNDLQERLERRDTAAVDDSALGNCASVKGWWEEGVVFFFVKDRAFSCVFFGGGKGEVFPRNSGKGLDLNRLVFSFLFCVFYHYLFKVMFSLFQHQGGVTLVFCLFKPKPAKR